MSLLNTQSRTRMHPLTGDQGDAPAWAASSTLKFFMKSIPLLTRGNLANYVPALCLTAYGNFTSGAIGTQKVTWEDLAFALYGSFDLQGAWHGRPLGMQHMRGATARIWELISMGYQSGSRHQIGGRMSGTNRAFRHTLYLPLSHCLGKNGARYTSQLALLFKDAHLEINTPANGQNAISTASTLTIANANIRCSAVLLPEASLRLAPGVEWIEAQTTGAVAGSDPVNLDSLGNASGLEGVEPGAGIDTMLALSYREGLLGSYLMSDLSRYSAPFLDQSQSVHLDPFVQMLEQVSAKGERPRDQEIQDALDSAEPTDFGRVIDQSGFPYGHYTTLDANWGVAGDGSKLPDSLLCFPLIVSGPELELTKIQRFEGASTYYRTIAAVQASTVDRTLYHQYKSFTPQKQEEFRKMLIASGLAGQVLNTAVLVPKTTRNEAGPDMDPSKARFFPQEFVPQGQDPNAKKQAA